MKHITNDLSANETIYEAIRQIAFHKLVNPRTNVMKNTSKISGYVVKVHTDADDALCGTVDVQEYLSSLSEQQSLENGLPVRSVVRLQLLQTHSTTFQMPDRRSSR